MIPIAMMIPVSPSLSQYLAPVQYPIVRVDPTTDAQRAPLGQAGAAVFSPHHPDRVEACD